MIEQLRRWWTGSTPKNIPDALWKDTVIQLPFLTGLREDEMTRLKSLCEEFLTTKQFSGAGELELTDTICLSIALQGCLPILNLGIDWYKGWHGIVVYPDEFVIPRETVDENGVVHHFQEIAAGEAWQDGPLIISWSDAQMIEDEYNVVIHEFAHKIDMLNGDADGCPPLQKNQSKATWTQVWTMAYNDFVQRVESSPLVTHIDEEGLDFEALEIDTTIDPYASENPGEFFAVVSEVFFTAPNALKNEYPDVYAQLTLFYDQDPAKRQATGS